MFSATGHQRATSPRSTRSATYRPSEQCRLSRVLRVLGAEVDADAVGGAVPPAQIAIAGPPADRCIALKLGGCRAARHRAARAPSPPAAHDRGTATGQPYGFTGHFPLLSAKPRRKPTGAPTRATPRARPMTRRSPSRRPQPRPRGPVRAFPAGRRQTRSGLPTYRPCRLHQRG